ncbi:MAG TPA: efflux RND transporter periplasmic adaptor subunit, partial [Saprospiraceae bacterium]|nr:efflux RND transporter periplasmic adaptor subunit [Saprospiraceae bacterium]
MKTKQLILVAGIFLLGIIIGKFAFSAKQTPTSKHTHQNETEEAHWTCSMHPQIDMPEQGQCPICGMDLFPKETGTDVDNQAPNSFKMSKNAVALANIETLVVGEIDRETDNNNTAPSLRLTGKIVANDKKTLMQTTHLGGRIEHLYHRSLGEYVQSGSLIASLYSPELVTAQHEFIEALEIQKTQPELYKAVRNKLKNWKIPEKQIQHIENTKKVITNFNMYANVSGYINKIFVEEGNHVKEGDPLFQVADLSSVWANMDVYEKDVQYVKKGQTIRLYLNAFPNEEITAKIDYIDPILNTKTRTVSIRATLQNKNTR